MVTEAEIIDRFLLELIALAGREKDQERRLKLLKQLRETKPRVNVVGSMVPLLTIEITY
jgi:hypothetical protein